MEELCREGVYIILDNFEKGEVNNNFLSSILQIKKILSVNFSICLVGVNFGESLLGEGEGGIVLPMVNISSENEEGFIKDLLRRDLREKCVRNETAFLKKMHDEISETYINDITSCFGSLITDLNLLKHLNWQIFLVVKHFAQQMQNWKTVLSSNAFKYMKRILLDNPYFLETGKEEFIEKINNILQRESRE